MAPQPAEPVYTPAMPSYRFCRPDDIPYLVRAINECYVPNFAGEPEMTVEAFRQEMKDIDLWPSNSMVASTSQGPIAVMIGTKRAHEVLILRLGVLPEHRRQGHGSHMLTSLSQKLAVLGPERLVVEAPRRLQLDAFLRAANYTFETTLVDYHRPVGEVEPVPDGWTLPISVDELMAEGLLERHGGRAWCRSHETLLARKDDLRGLAIASPERLEAFLLFDPSPTPSGALAVLALECLDGARRDLFSGVLLRALATRRDGALELPRLGDGEVPVSVLEAAGFKEGESYDRYCATATPA